MELSLRWAKRSKIAHGDNPSALFGIVQGGMHEDLRLRSLEGLCEIGFDGLAIGGLSVGEPKEDMIRILDFLPPHMPPRKTALFKWVWVSLKIWLKACAAVLICLIV